MIIKTQLVPIAAPQPISDAEVARRLTEHQSQAQGALAPNTVDALRRDVQRWSAWAECNGYRAVPAEPQAVADYVSYCVRVRKCSHATIRRYCSSIAALHRAAGVLSPTTTELVKLTLRKLAREVGTRQRQAKGLTRKMFDRLVAAIPCPADPQLRTDYNALRDRAMLHVQYDAMLRRSELIAITVEDIACVEDGSGILLVRSSKTDQAREGVCLYLAPDTMRALLAYVTSARISTGRVFPLSPHGVNWIYATRAAQAGIDPRGISSHSLRIGAAQDQMAAGLEIGEIMRAGRWKSTQMVYRYTERLELQRGASAKLARSQGRA